MGGRHPFRCREGNSHLPRVFQCITRTHLERSIETLEGVNAAIFSSSWRSRPRHHSAVNYLPPVSKKYKASWDLLSGFHSHTRLESTTSQRLRIVAVNCQLLPSLSLFQSRFSLPEIWFKRSASHLNRGPCAQSSSSPPQRLTPLM